MSSKFTNFFQDDEDTNPAFLRMVRNLLLLLIAGGVTLLPLTSGIFGETSHDPVAFALASAAVIFEIISLYFVNMGKPAMAKLVIPVSSLITIVATSATSNGLRDTSIVGLPVILVGSALLMGRRAIWIMTPLTILSVVAIAIFDTGRTQPVEAAGFTQAAVISVLIVICAAITYLLVNRLLETAQKARESEQAAKAENEKLNNLRQTLEDRVMQRTVEIESSNARYERRVTQFEAIAQITRVITSIQDMDTLLPYITQVISEHFGVYHTGIFLLDKQREFAILRAANSDGGRRMLARGHKLRIGQTGIVGFVTATGQARIALDVGNDTTYFDNPDMPETRSEIALPLRYAGQIIGALDVQSIEPNAFLRDDIEVLTTLADQVATTINNAVVLEENRKQIEKQQKTTEEGMREYWKVMRPKSLGLGLRLSEAEIYPLETPLEGEHIQDAVAQNKAILHTPADAPATLAVPLRLRGKVVGVMNLQARSGYQLTGDDAEIVEAVVERLSLALESASLLQATQHRANIERITTDIASRISASSRFETIMQTAAQEISRALGGSDVTVQIEPVSIELGMGS